VFEPVKSLPAASFVRIHVDGQSVRARTGTSLAIALMEAGIAPLRRTEISGAPRSPLCLMGVCFECLCEVDGRHNVQACLVPVADGMRVALSQGARPMDAPA
jgi:D-hydroxyproline dehydrogenase subunit gamma